MWDADFAVKVNNNKKRDIFRYISPLVFVGDGFTPELLKLLSRKAVLAVKLCM